ncbi:anhydro-N-acetylmuramic acid kinase [Microbacterium sp. KSW4-16]|uniref:anhydro-N-acetylmuramic acid kinase n=1 Tax=Microbacterium TaxID=33882 RepID=UPI00103C3699|nr:MULTISPECIES: anhydro-N-acetylmuramic acid kinase [Microbacterium]MCK8468993.1 anhydro-N-acetylmuramic acid kinase [Microbacterium aurugineum]TCJ21433.1 anhydro-N-acetylmuramic acid kinase [Microbacterium sp. PI-1]
MRVLGLISGTSHDGIDAAVVDFTTSGGFTAHGVDLRGTVLAATSVPYTPELRSRLIAALPPAQTTLAEVAELDTLIGQAFADVAADIAAEVGGIDAVCSHGQTVYHWVDGAHARGTLQIGQPAWIAEKVGAPVVSDIRIRDITVGGHGAPLVSFLDELLLRSRAGVSAALNLGGISNMTVVRQDGLVAYDIGPANALVDAVIVEHGLNPLGYDDDAAIARTGQVDETLLAALLEDPYYALTPPKSTGKEHFHLGYVHEHLAAQGREIAVADVVRTLTELTVRTVARDVEAAGIGFLAVSGGGCRNPLILDGLRAALPATEVVLADELGAAADSKEAILLALIGWSTMHGVPAIVPGGTGAREPRILGTITPGVGPLQMPEPVAAIDSLVLTEAATS